MTKRFTMRSRAIPQWYERRYEQNFLGAQTKVTGCSRAAQCGMSGTRSLHTRTKRRSMQQQRCSERSQRMRVAQPNCNVRLPLLVLRTRSQVLSHKSTCVWSAE